MTGSILSGPKFNQTHQTYVDGAVDILELLKKSDSIKKIMLGPIEPTSPGVRHCKIRSIEGNLLAIAFRDVCAIQVIRAVISIDTSLIQNIEACITKLNPKLKFSRPKKSRPKVSLPVAVRKQNRRGGIDASQIKPTLRDQWPGAGNGRLGLTVLWRA